MLVVLSAHKRQKLAQLQDQISILDAVCLSLVDQDPHVLFSPFGLALPVPREILAFAESHVANQLVDCFLYSQEDGCEVLYCDLPGMFVIVARRVCWTEKDEWFGFVTRLILEELDMISWQWIQ